MKYIEYFVSIGGEVPDEINLCIAIAECPRACRNCSWQGVDIKKDLTDDVLNEIIQENEGVTCVCYLGGDWDLKGIQHGINIAKSHGLKTALYSGDSLDNKDKYINNLDLDYLKIGPYIDRLGGLDNKETNQRFYCIDEKVTDCTELFRRKYEAY